MWGRNLVAKGLMYIMTSKALFIGLQPTDLTGKVVRDDYTVIIIIIKTAFIRRSSCIYRCAVQENNILKTPLSKSTKLKM